MIAFNLARAGAVAAGLPTARWATLRIRIVNLPGRLAASSRRLTLHLPQQWPWAPGWQQLWTTATATGPPAVAPT